MSIKALRLAHLETLSRKGHDLVSKPFEGSDCSRDHAVNPQSLFSKSSQNTGELLGNIFTY